MRLFTLSVLLLALASSAAYADRGRGRGHGRPVVRDHRANTSFQRTVIVRGNRHTGPARTDRRVIQRRPLYSNNGAFRFHNGVSVTYRRPAIQHHHYDANVRPQVIVESYPQQSGYIWVAGNWSWNGYEWIWTAGYYAPDPAYTTYYDDGSYE